MRLRHNKSWRGRIVPATVIASIVVLAGATGGAVWSAWSSGWRVRTIATASMAPRYPVGTLVLVEAVTAPSEVVEGTVLVFTDPADRGRTIAHRVVGTVTTAAGGTAWQTKGDANGDVDPYPVHLGDVQGRVRLLSPALGSAVSTAQKPGAPAVLVGLPLLLLALSEAVERERRRRRRRRISVAAGSVAAAA
ncbi:MAG TPA: signal peptidase I [Acidimicrobiales bacterium]|nr:signal peptidase I [Acidimicrobiales bacterium]